MLRNYFCKCLGLFAFKFVIGYLFDLMVVSMTMSSKRHAERGGVEDIMQERSLGTLFPVVSLLLCSVWQVMIEGK